MSDSGADLRTSLHAVVCSIQCEMDVLIQQKADLTRQIRNVRRQLRKRAANPVQKKKKNRSHRARTAKTARIRGMYEGLSRACRIALLEAGGQATTERIYTLIRHRGSFSFDALASDPKSDIARALHLMSMAGEVQQLSNDPRSAWQWIDNRALNIQTGN